MDKNRNQNKNNGQSQKKNDHNRKNDRKQARPQQEARPEAKALEASQIRNLIRNNGKLALGNCEYILRQPASNNAQLHDIIRDPAFTARQAEPLRNASENRYELRSNNRTAQITIDCKPNKKA